MRDMEVGPELMASAVAGDAAAVERLLVAHHDRLVATLRRRVGSSASIDVLDVAQQAYCDAFKSISTFKPGADPDGFFRWLLAIARHRLSDMRRAERARRRGGEKASRSPRPSLDQVADWVVAASNSSPSRIAARHEAEAALSDALAQLPEDYRMAIRLRYVRGLSVAQVALEMGRTEGAVHMLCNRALRRLREVLGSASRFFTRGVSARRR